MTARAPSWVQLQFPLRPSGVAQGAVPENFLTHAAFSPIWTRSGVNSGESAYWPSMGWRTLRLCVKPQSFPAPGRHSHNGPLTVGLASSPGGNHFGVAVGMEDVIVNRAAFDQDMRVGWNQLVQVIHGRLSVSM